MTRASLISLVIFVLWFFPGYYLTTHEAGHCVSASQLGSIKNDLYLGCLNRSDTISYNLNLSSSSSIKVCSPFLYSFAAQKGFCSYQMPLGRQITLSRLERSWIAVSGSVYGFFANYLLFLVCFSLSLLIRRKQISLFDFLRSPFRIHSMVLRVKGDSFGKKVLLWAVSFGYMLHIERLFYGFLPASVFPFFPPLRGLLFGDGNAVWSLFIHNISLLQTIGWIFWFVSLFIYYQIIRYTWRLQKLV